MLPRALRLARELNDELETTGGEVISAGLVGEIAAYFLRATRVALHATASVSDAGVEELLAAPGQHLAES